MATCSGMGGRIRPESVEALERNDWKDYPGIRTNSVWLPRVDEFRNFLMTWEASFMAKWIQELLGKY